MTTRPINMTDDQRSPQATITIKQGVALDRWVLDILADPLTKLPTTPNEIGTSGGVIDARRFLRNTIGFVQWDDGQSAYEGWERSTIEDYKNEVDGVVPVYDHIRMYGRILDVGGGAGSVRHFIPPDTQFVSVDPFIDCLDNIPPAKKVVYPCLKSHLNFIAACAEFLPFQAASFDWVHMRSMLDHVHSPDLALIEARRVLKPAGKLVIGLYVDGGKSGRRAIDRQLKEIARPILTTIGFRRFKDHHLFHPTFNNLEKIILDNGFKIDDIYWQPAWRDTVCYITATPSTD
ncbi:class I SAM-dependent methyltransferase [Bradyrhizobium erythrophlei]|uniref:Ubiquinone/menaquinone biosynthesis C-methylase UbiE n=1 Tax=Bradyrhizobium erythrophlei TaxID=1437360 RepID=A0A1M7UHX3_9BRAD|nr:class I SAM-dependent methyltransferase [Bradyrhizobium erythrophlei]SHN82477.1 Ubiquinone/menaquinone biosynthesis C-methylase UbiE [Bradyrhizobium erythrophlei]